MNHIKYLLATIAAFTFVMFIVMFPVLLKAQEKMPDDMYEFAAPMTFMCVDSFTRMMEILEKDYQEIPMVISHLTPSMSMVLFVNHDSTTSTVVVTKRTTLNPNPAFPVET